jgi:hypothetical protein
LNKIIKIAVSFFTFWLFVSCNKDNQKLQLIYDGKNSYTVQTNDDRVILSFRYNENFSHLPSRLIVYNEKIQDPMMIYIDFDDDENILGYKISDGKLFSDEASVLPEDNILVIHKENFSKKQIIYEISEDGKITILNFNN